MDKETFNNRDKNKETERVTVALGPGICKFNIAHFTDSLSSGGRTAHFTDISNGSLFSETTTQK